MFQAAGLTTSAATQRDKVGAGVRRKAFRCGCAATGGNQCNISASQVQEQRRSSANMMFSIQATKIFLNKKTSAGGFGLSWFLHQWWLEEDGWIKATRDWPVGVASSGLNVGHCRLEEMVDCGSNSETFTSNYWLFGGNLTPSGSDHRHHWRNPVFSAPTCLLDLPKWLFWQMEQSGVAILIWSLVAT